MSEPTTCPACNGVGDTSDRRWLESFVSLILLAGEHPHRKDANGLHPYLARLPRVIGASQPPSMAFADLTAGLAGRAPRGVLGHDALDRWAATSAIVKAAGLDPDTWGICPTCKGEGEVNP